MTCVKVYLCVCVCVFLNLILLILYLIQQRLVHTTFIINLQNIYVYKYLKIIKYLLLFNKSYR